MHLAVLLIHVILRGLILQRQNVDLHDLLTYARELLMINLQFLHPVRVLFRFVHIHVNGRQVDRGGSNFLRLELQANACPHAIIQEVQRALGKLSFLLLLDQASTKHERSAPRLINFVKKIRGKESPHPPGAIFSPCLLNPYTDA